MYLTNRFKANLEKIRVASEARGEARGRAEGKVEGIAEADQVWTDWYQRLESAKARGVPFDEPPPFLNRDNTEG